MIFTNQTIVKDERRLSMKRLLLFVLLTALFIPGLAEARYRAGDLVEDFTLPDASGSLVSLSDFSDKIVCIYFWAST